MDDDETLAAVNAAYGPSDLHAAYRAFATAEAVKSLWRLARERYSPSDDERAALLADLAAARGGEYVVLPDLRSDGGAVMSDWTTAAAHVPTPALDVLADAAVRFSRRPFNCVVCTDAVFAEIRRMCERAGGPPDRVLMVEVHTRPTPIEARELADRLAAEGRTVALCGILTDEIEVLPITASCHGDELTAEESAAVLAALQDGTARPTRKPRRVADDTPDTPTVVEG